MKLILEGDISVKLTAKVLSEDEPKSEPRNK